MMPDSSTLIGAAADMVTLLLVVAMILAFIRVVRGPSLPDRVIALDLISTVAVGLIAIYSISTGQLVYLPAAIMLALIAFLGTVALALYIEKGGPP